MRALPKSIDQTQALLGGTGYLCGRGLATVVILSLKLGRPLFLEGKAGVGKTEIAKALAVLLYGGNHDREPDRRRGAKYRRHMAAFLRRAHRRGRARGASPVTM